MNTLKAVAVSAVGCISMWSSGLSLAAVSPEQAALLGKTLTMVGAERKGNADGSIPDYLGKAAFPPDMLKLTTDDLEALRARLVSDIAALVSDPKVVSDVLLQAQVIMDAEPDNAAQVLGIVRQMLSSDTALKAEFDRVLGKRGKSVDGLLNDVEQGRIKLPQISDDVAIVVESLQGQEDWVSKLVKAFDIGRVLEIISIVDDPVTRVKINEMMVRYMPSYVQGFLEYRDPGKSEAGMLEGIKPLYVVSRKNLKQYDHQLTESHKALFATYPDYKMIVYPSQRNAFFPQEILDATKANATRAKLVGTDGAEGAELGFPFPIPSSGAEVLWNHKLKFRGSAARRYNNQAIVKANGEYKISKLLEDVKFKYGSLTEPASKKKNNLMAYYMQEVLSPARVAGQLILVHENAVGLGNTRQAWIYSPGLARVNRAPDVGFDTPSVGSDGEQFNDQIDMFNGSLERFNYKLVGKKDLLIPYNSWILNSPTFQYKDIIRPGHINQDLARYELHRVWVVEATVREGHRHRFGKRRFYLDEDSWAIAVVDCYDNRGEFWKAQEAHLITAPFIPTVTGVPELIYDLQSKRFFATAMTNEDAIPNFNVSYSDREFQPSALRQKARGR